MSKTNRKARQNAVFMVAGGALGAAVRYLISGWAEATIPVLLTTVVSVGAGFILLGFVLASPVGGDLRSLVAGAAGAVGSVSTYATVGITATFWLAVSLLVLTPVIAAASFAVGAALGVSLSSTAESRADVPA
jgi:fluoride ion exporter CrcB/FEX